MGPKPWGHGQDGVVGASPPYDERAVRTRDPNPTLPNLLVLVHSDHVVHVHHDAGIEGEDPGNGRPQKTSDILDEQFPFGSGCVHRNRGVRGRAGRGGGPAGTRGQAGPGGRDRARGVHTSMKIW